MVVNNNPERYVSRPSGGLVNLPDRKEVDMRRFLLMAITGLIALALLTFAASSQNSELQVQPGGNGGLVNLPGGGVSITGPGPFQVEQPLNAPNFVPISYVIGSGGRVVVLGLYNDFIVQVHLTNEGKILYEATLTATAINPGARQLVSRWECTCHPGVTQEVITDCNGSMRPEWYQEDHDKRLAIALHKHPAKTQQ